MVKGKKYEYKVKKKFKLRKIVSKKRKDSKGMVASVKEFWQGLSI